MSSVLLSDQERRAVDAFLGEHWSEFVEHALTYLDDEEVDELADKLSGGL